MSETVSVEALKEHFPPQVLEPYGQVLIIPNRMFKRGWELELEAQGHRVFATSYNGESSFLVRLDKGAPRNQNSNQPKPVENKLTNEPSSEKLVIPTGTEKPIVKGRKKPWTLEEEDRLKVMLKKGMSQRAIGECLGRSRVSIQGKVQRMSLVEVRLEPTKTTETDTTPNPLTVDKDPVVEGDVVKELLEATSLLYPKYRYACKVLLSEAASKMEEKE